MRYLPLLLVLACATGPETGTFAFRAAENCDGLGPTRFYVDEREVGEVSLEGGDEVRFEVSAGVHHEGRAQQLTGRLLYFDTQGAVVESGVPVTYLLQCSAGTR